VAKLKRGQTVANINPVTSLLRAVLVVLALTVFTVPASALEISDLDTATSTKVDRFDTLVAQGKSVDDEVKDPIESFNREIFAFNEFFLDNILSPLTKVYQVLPDPMEQAIGNVLHNIKSPIILLHDLLQGEWSRASITSRRILMNTTLGLGGLIDLADHAGMPRHKEDLGQTLAVWGVPEGPYLVIPFLGPSNPRDIIGKLLDSYIDPISNWANNTDREEINYTRLGLTAVDEYGSVRKELKEIKKTSIDYYASIRSLYRQKRASEIRNGKEQKLPPIPDFFTYHYDEPEDEDSAKEGASTGFDVYRRSETLEAY
jgi:phospholipid-binding lipoprotein MlaA